jgi:hypothetical protein
VRYREALPADCPPEDSEEVVAVRMVYRIVRTAPAADDDFRSLQDLKPSCDYGSDSCMARGLSVFTDKIDCEQRLKLPSLRGRLVCAVTLRPGAGRLKQTRQPSHQTWWPLADFDILSNCETDLL